MNQLEDLLLAGAQRMGINMTDAQVANLCRYVELLVKWNKAYNLTAVRDPQDMVTRHILDSLSILSCVEEMVQPGQSLLDVGSGPGLPGIPLAIMLPDRQISTLDCVGKKIRFQRQVVMELGLENLTPINERVEAYQPQTPFDVVTSRAFSSLIDLMKGTDHLLAGHGMWLAMKGIHPEMELQELQAVRPDISLKVSHPLTVAGCEEQRHLVILERINGARAV